MKDKYRIVLRVFTAAYEGDGDSRCWGEDDLKRALEDLLSNDRGEVTKALIWLRQNVRAFIQLENEV